MELQLTFWVHSVQQNWLRLHGGERIDGAFSPKFGGDLVFGAMINQYIWELRCAIDPFQVVFQTKTEAMNKTRSVKAFGTASPINMC